MCCAAAVWLAKHAYFLTHLGGSPTRSYPSAQPKHSSTVGSCPGVLLVPHQVHPSPLQGLQTLFLASLKKPAGGEDSVAWIGGRRADTAACRLGAGAVAAAGSWGQWLPRLQTSAAFSREPLTVLTPVAHSGVRLAPATSKATGKQGGEDRVSVGCGQGRQGYMRPLASRPAARLPKWPIPHTHTTQFQHSRGAVLDLALDTRLRGQVHAPLQA